MIEDPWVLANCVRGSTVTITALRILSWTTRGDELAVEYRIDPGILADDCGPWIARWRLRAIAPNGEDLSSTGGGLSPVDDVIGDSSPGERLFIERHGSGVPRVITLQATSDLGVDLGERTFTIEEPVPPPLP